MSAHVSENSPLLRESRIRRSRWVGPTSAAVVGVLFTVWFNRGFFFSGFSTFEGDWGDGRFVALVASHWANPMQFPGGWLDLGIFSPYTDTLPYSDTFLIHGILSAPLQWLGIGVLPAFQWSLIALTAVSYAAAVAFMRLGPRSPWLPAIGTGVLVVFSNGLALSSAHPQLRSVSLGGVVLLLGLMAWRARSAKAAAAWSFAYAAILALVVVSTFYAGWMLVLGLALVTALAIVMLAIKRMLPRWSKLGPLVVGAGVGVLVVVPVFIAIYGTAISQGASRSLDVALGSSLRMSELVMMSELNVLWGSAIGAAFSEVRPYEFWFAPSLFLLAGVGALIVRGLWRWKTASTWTLIGLSFGIAGLISWLIPVNYFGWSPWELIYNIPGAQAIRAIGRFELLAGFLLAIALGILVATALHSTFRPGRIILTGLLLVVMVEQFNTVERQSHSEFVVTAEQELAPPPQSCRSFVLLEPRWDIPGFAEQIDAMAIARSTGLPTINGYSGWTPPDWTLDIDAPDYLRNARSWSGRWFIQGLCGYRASDNSWLDPDATREFLAQAARG